MTINRAGGKWLVCIALVFGTLCIASAQCPGLPTSSASGNANILCEGSSVTFSTTGVNLPIGSNVDWYLFTDGTQNPYNGEGTIIGSAPVTGDPCSNPPSVLYIMVNPDNNQVGGSGDQCDEFMVLWTGSGGFSTTDISVTNLGPGTFQWDSFVAGNAGNFSCGVALPPGPVPANAILIIQSSPNNNVPINSDVLCASGLPVYIIAYDGTGACTGGYFDNNSPCSSCPVMIDLAGSTCQFDLDLDYSPPGSSIDGWGWANTGSGVFADVIPPLNIPTFNPPAVIVDDFVWTVPNDFCETMGGGDYWVAGIPNPPPTGGCPEITTSYFGLEVSCPEASLSGGGDVCEGNCPDNPTLIEFDLTGNDLPFEADLVFTASGFPPFPINDLSIPFGYHIQVCLGGGIFPSFDPGTGILTVPSLAIGITATVTIVSMTSNAGCPVTVDPASISITFLAAPTADAGPDQVICEGETVTLNGSIGGSAVDSEWSTNGDGDFDDPFDLNAEYTPGPNDIVSGSVTLTLTSSDANGSCIPAQSTMDITIQPSIEVTTNTPLTICDNDVANIVATLTGGIASFTWETSGDGDFDDPSAASTIYTPGNNDVNSGSVTLTYTPDDPNTCVINSAPIILTLVAAPIVMIPQDLEICSDAQAEFDISLQGAYSSVVWSTTGDGSLTVVNETQVTYVPGPNDISAQFVVISVTVQSSFPECGSTTYNIPINIVDCNCPDLETIPPTSPLCATNGILDLNDLFVVGDPGSWSIISAPPGSNPASIVGSQFIVNHSDAGSYVVAYNVAFPQPGCPASSMETIIVSAPIVPEAGPDQTFCGPDTILLNGIYTPLDPLVFFWASSGNGTFSDNTNLTTSYLPGSSDSLAPGVFISLHVLDTVCGEQIDSMSAFFNAEPFATFTNDTVMICDETAYGSVLNFTALITSGDIAGTWTNIDGVLVDMSNPAAVDFNGIAEGYYAFGYQTNAAMFPCTEKSYVIYVHVESCSCPLLVLNNPPAGICNDLVSLPLDAFIQAGAPGTWQILSAPPGSNPATLTGSVLNVNGVDQGDYRLRFTFNAAPLVGCVDSTEFTIFIQDAPTLVLQNDTAVCGGAAFAVTGAIGGSAVSFQWTTTGSGSFSPNTGSPSFYQPTATEIVALGQVYLIGTTQDTFGYCAADKDSLHVTYSIPPFAILSQTNITICNDPDSGSVVNLSSFIIGGDVNGIWSDVDGAGVNLGDVTAVDFDGVTPGAYDFSYSTNSAIAPCVEATYSFTVMVENCACPSLALTEDTIVVCKSSPYQTDFSAISVNADPGTWSIPPGQPAGLFFSGNVLNYAAADAGIYILRYTLIDSVAGCPASANLVFILDTTPTFTIVSKTCDANNNFYSVYLASDALSVSADAGDLMQVGNTVQVTNIPIAHALNISGNSTHNACSNALDITPPDCNCTLMIEDLVDTLTLCPGDTTRLIPFVTGAAGFPATYWINVNNQDTVKHFSFKVSEPGTYIWVVIDTLQCEERDTFTAVFIGPTAIEFTSVSPTCPNETDGEIIIEAVVDGLPPYSVQLDNQAPVAVGVFPFTIPSVGLGQHIIAITDLTGCTFEQPVTVSNNSFGNIDLGPDVSILKGDSVLINPEVNNINVSAVQWNLPGLAPDLSPFWIKPDSTTLLQVTVTDTAGCIYTDEMVITVLEKTTFYIPNIFSPNDDQINDQIIVNTNIPDDRLVSFEIFDRWGGMLYRQVSNLPFSWDGKNHGQKLNPGVYVYKLTYLDERTKQLILIGDITLVR